jgi:NADH-quinone oxidoreductase subunit N
MLGVFFVSLRQYKYINFVKEFQYLLIFIFVTGLLLLINTPIENLVIFNNLLVIDPLILAIKFVLLVTTICCIIVSFNYLKTENVMLFEYNILILLSILGLLCFVSANDFVSFYLALELQSLSFYILASFKKDSAFSTEAGLKYFILGALSSGFLLFGISLVYGAIGSTNFEVLSKTIAFLDFNSIMDNELSLRVVLGSLFILISLLFKLTAAPFHM